MLPQYDYPIVITDQQLANVLYKLRPRLAGEKPKIKATVEFTVSGGSLEDALAEYDEITVEGLLREVIDKAIACDEIQTKVVEGPNTLEDYDEGQTASQG